MYNPQLDAFIKAADSGSFSKAAEAMYISVPAIIQQINLLEASCGFKLFVRSNQGVKLTADGRSLYEDAKTIIRLSQDALGKARNLAQSSEMIVRIGTSLLYKCRLLPDLWTKISEKHPELKIEILPMTKYQNRGEVFSALGIQFDPLFARGNIRFRSGAYRIISHKKRNCYFCFERKQKFKKRVNAVSNTF